MPFRLIVNDVPVSLPAWHVKGRFGEGDEAVATSNGTSSTIRTTRGARAKPARRVDTPMSDTNTYSKTLQLEDLCDLRP
jgi:hypothetical protein